MIGLSPDRRALCQALLLVGALILPWLLPSQGPLDPAPAPAQNTWAVGNLVGLSRGTQIRQGPGFSSCYHTYVPEDNWTVKVKDGPRRVDGRIWWDTSRRDAGDPSGGTGWVNQEQVDQFHGARDPGPGQACPGSQAWYIDNPTPTPTPTRTPTCEQSIPSSPSPDLWYQWWQCQAMIAKIAIAVVAFVLIPASDRLRIWRNMALIGFVRAVLWGIVLGTVVELTRSIWLPYWDRLPLEWHRIDPVLLALFAPLGVWAFGYLAGAFSIALAIGLLLAVIFAFLLYIYALESVLR